MTYFMSCAHLWNHHWQGSFNENCDFFFEFRHFDIFRWYTIGERLGKEVLTCWPEIKYTQLLLHFSYVLRIFIKILNEFLFEFLTNVTYDCWAPCYLQVQKIIRVTIYLGIESKCKCSQFLRKKWINCQAAKTDWHEYHCTSCDSVTDYDNLDELSQHKVNVLRQRKSSIEEVPPGNVHRSRRQVLWADCPGRVLQALS